ncbi:MAG: leucyl aminopeptidase [Desulfobacterales bacterium]|jgi:leucyl aminopeptidase
MLSVRSADLTKTKIDTLAIPVCEDKNIYLDTSLKAVIKKAFNLKEFKGKKEQSITLYNLPEIKARRVIFWGLGKFKDIDREALRSMAGNAVKNCIQKEPGNLWFAVPEVRINDLETSAVLKALQEGAYLGNHLFDKYKGKKKKKALRKINFRVATSAARKLRPISDRVEAVCKGTTLARDWINIPSNDKTPEKLTRSIVNRAKKQGLKVKVLNETQLKQKKMGALLAVAAGSHSKPSLVVLEYKVPGAQKTIALVGKGVTFDSGGLNIKIGNSMIAMKSDMSGAAAVAASLIIAGQIKPKFNLIGAIPIVENMLSGKAIRPGDIIRSYSGKTIEIGNTDAEGRLILVDAMSYVIKTHKPHFVIDVATLTGACVVALGEKLAGVFSNDTELAAAIIAAGERTYERCWQLPLPEDYKKMLKSKFADISNIGRTRWGGAIAAALFLSEFTSGTPWAHIDIAGPAYSLKESAYCGAGGTGFGVRLLVELLDRLAS